MFDHIVLHPGRFGRGENPLPVEISGANRHHDRFSSLVYSEIFDVQNFDSAVEPGDPVDRISASFLDPECVEFAAHKRCVPVDEFKYRAPLEAQELNRMVVVGEIDSGPVEFFRGLIQLFCIGDGFSFPGWYPLRSPRPAPEYRSPR